MCTNNRFHGDRFSIIGKKFIQQISEFSNLVQKNISYAEHYHFQFKCLLILKEKIPCTEERSAWPRETIYRYS